MLYSVRAEASGNALSLEDISFLIQKASYVQSDQWGVTDTYSLVSSAAGLKQTIKQRYRIYPQSPYVCRDIVGLTSG